MAQQSECDEDLYLQHRGDLPAAVRAADDPTDLSTVWENKKPHNVNYVVSQFQSYLSGHIILNFITYSSINVRPRQSKFLKNLHHKKTDNLHSRKTKSWDSDI